MNLYYTTMDSPLGPLWLGATDKGLCALRFLVDPVEVQTARVLEELDLDQAIHDPQDMLLIDTADQLDLYFRHELTDFDLPFDLIGTPFRVAVWEEMLKIAYGHLVTYGDIAKALGDPNKSRACGGAIGANPIPIIVPCHRVVGGNGALTGFSAPGGIKLKTKILRLEGLETDGERVTFPDQDHQLTLF